MSAQAAIEVFELAEILHHRQVVVLDCRYDLAEPYAGEQRFREGHIPGARYASLHRDLSAPVGRYGGRHPLPDPQQFQQFARRAGISRDTRVIVYDDQRLAFAARAWWLLRYFGHEQVSVLNGGLRAWREAGLPQESGDGMAPAQSGGLTCRPQSHLVIGYGPLHGGMENPPWQLVDARDSKRFLGTEEPIDPIAGHIPTAINKPWQCVTDDSGMLKSIAELAAHWRDIPADKQLVHYCGSGVTACVNLFSLHLIGRNDTLLYAGSWSDWCAHILHPDNSDQSTQISETEPLIMGSLITDH
ncbi:sulfurtransferase [Microbulbifer sp.]|uniref:sulfurtransferase n=1 Tax=Microbulbifer sp. TaxID=1908541 RepID=UPI003F3F8E26